MPNLNPNDRIAVLFVCTGNICRSPTAEAVFRHMVIKAGLEERFLIDSAGTHGYHIGDPPDPRTIATALSRGVDMHDLRARKATAVDFMRFHYILSMDLGHHVLMDRLRPDDFKGGLGLFLGFPKFGALGRDVPDPYYGTQTGFDHVYEMIERGCHRLLIGLREIHRL